MAQRIQSGEQYEVFLIQGSAVPGLSIPEHDYIGLTYVTAGNGTGEIETVTYKQGGDGGDTVALLTLAYDGNNNLISVTKS